jgi:retinol dehydrogenase-12
VSTRISRVLTSNFTYNWLSGVMVPPIEMVTAQGYDLQFGTNVVGHYLLTNLLLPMIESTAKETGHPGRVVDVSSIMHILSGNPVIRFETLKDDPARKRMSREALYAQSKSVSTLARWRRLSEN